MEVNLGITKVMVCSGITHYGMPKSKVDPCGVCSLRVELAQYCVQCGDWVHGRKGSVKGDSKVLRKLCMQKM